MKIVATLAVIVIGFVAFVATRPSSDAILRIAVTWSMVGQTNFIAKIIHLFVDMDTMIGGNFERGLADMKSIVEAGGTQR